MGAAALATPEARAVGDLLVAAFREVLGKRLGVFVVHGSAVTGYVAGFSDFDFVLFLHGPLSLDDGFALQQRLRATDYISFTYAQISRVIDLDDPAERSTGLIDGAYAPLLGELPDGWTFHQEETLRERGRNVLLDIPHQLRSRNEDWATGTAVQRQRSIRLLATVLKPSLRALLCELGEPVMATWTSPYQVLSTAIARHDVRMATMLNGLLPMLPPTGQTESLVARLLFDLLVAIDGHAAAFQEPAGR